MIDCVGTPFVVVNIIVVVVVDLLPYSEYLVDCFCWC